MGRGKKGTVNYLNAVQADFHAKLAGNPNEKVKSRLIRRLFALEREIEQLMKLLEASRLARHLSEGALDTEFIPLEMFALNLANTGTGNGQIMSAIIATNYFCGSTITLHAQADSGSVFKKWHGDASGSDDVCSVVINSEISVGAEFQKMFIPNPAETFKVELTESLARVTSGVAPSSMTTIILKRVDLLEQRLTEVLDRLDTIQRALSQSADGLVPTNIPPTPTLLGILKWLAAQDRILVADLRVRLLPLDLLTSALIDKLNERALDLTGELALEEVEDEIVVTKDIFDDVLADWKSTKPLFQH